MGGNWSKTGKHPLAYLGVEPTTPPQMVIEKRDPTSDDNNEFNIGTIWVVSEMDRIWMLMDLEDGTADWVMIHPSEAAHTFNCDVGVANSSGGVLNVFGGNNIRTEGDGANTLSIVLQENVSIPGTLTLSSLGAGFVRTNATGDFSVISDGTDGQVLIASTSGAPAWANLTSSDSSVVITEGSNSIDLRSVGGGSGTLTTLDTESGSATPTSGVVRIIGDSSNIETSAAGNVVTIALKNNISVSGTITAAGDITSTSGDISGAAITSTGLVTAGNGLTVSAGNITTPLGAGVVQSSAAGVLSSSNGSNGQLIIGGGTAPAWATVTSSDSSLTLTPGANSLDIKVASSGSTGVLDYLDGDTGTATVTAGAITIAGGTNITTSGAASTLTVDLDNNVSLSGTLTVTPLQGTVYADSSGNFTATQGTDLQLYVGKTGISPEWLTPVSEDGSVTIAYGTVAGTINFQATGGAGGGAITTLSADTGSSVPDAAGDIKIEGGDNINTSAAGNTITVNLDKSIYQPSTNASGSEGVYYLNSLSFLHAYGTSNTFVGEEAGNFTLTGTVNTGAGYRSLKYLTSGNYNTAFGAHSLRRLGSGSYNIAVGYNAGVNLLSSESSNIHIGHSGVTGESNVIRIGVQGSGAGQQNKCLIAGIMEGGTLDHTYTEPVMVDQYGQLSTDGSSTDGDLLIGSTANGMRRAKLTSTDGSITIINGSNSIDLSLPDREEFMARQQYDVANVTGDGTMYYLGTQSVMQEYFDTGNNFYIGDGSGTACYYTAPVTGKYYFTAAVLVTNLVQPSPPVTTYVDPLNIVTTKRTYQLINPVLQFLGTQSVFYSVLADMDAGDTCKFAFGANLTGVGKTLGIGGANTKVSGYLVSRG